MMNTSKLTYHSTLNSKIIALFCFLFLLNSFLSFSQEKEVNTHKKEQPSIKYRKNELKIGALKMILIPMLDLEYERMLNKYSSFGGNMWISLDKDRINTKFLLSPFFRIYFTESKEYGSKGFFAQVSTGYYTGRRYNYDYFSTAKDNRDFNSFGVGFGVGWKWINKGGFLLQITTGIVRALSDTKVAPNFLFQGGIYIGYRF